MSRHWRLNRAAGSRPVKSVTDENIGAGLVLGYQEKDVLIRVLLMDSPIEHHLSPDNSSCGGMRVPVPWNVVVETLKDRRTFINQKIALRVI